MVFKKIAAIASVGLVVSGCSELHSEQYKNTKSITEHNIDGASEVKKMSVDKVVAGATMDDFYVNTNPVKIIVSDKLELPNKYNTPLVFYSALPETESALSTRLVADYGVTIKFSRMIQKKDDDEGVDGGQGVKGGNGTPDGGSLSEGGDSKDSADIAAPSISALPKSILDGMSVFGSAATDQDKDLVSPINYEGSVAGLMDLIAADRGLDWKYDINNDTFVFYDLDTITFSLIDNSGESSSSMSVLTSVTNQGGSTSNTRQMASMSTKYNNWGAVEKTVAGMIGEYGTYSGDQGRGTIVVTDTKENLARIKKIIDAINTQSGIQVVLDVTFLKFSLDKSSSFGTDLSDLGGAEIIGKAVGLSGGSHSLSKSGMEGSLYNINFNKAGVAAMIHALGKYGVMNYKFSDEIITLNNQLMPYQSTIDESYVSSIKTTTDDDGNESKSAVVAVRKAGITSTWVPRVVGDLVKVSGHITMARALSLEKNTEFGISLPKNLSENVTIDSIIGNGKTRIAAIKEMNESKASSSGVGGADSLPFGGGENTSTTREISIVLVTPYIVKQ